MDKKVILTYYDIEGNTAVETLWAEFKEDIKYQIKNIPFFAPNIAFNDIITVEEENGNLHFDEIINASEHSTIQIVFFNEKEMDKVIKDIELLNCSWEGMYNQKLLAIDVPPNVNYSIVKEYLTTQFNSNIIDFKESRVADMSAIEALKKLTEQYKNYNKKVVLRHLSADCVRLLENAGGFIEVNIEEDPVYNVMPE